jgi:cytosine/adenosine deaminase-related metal-dependent hydrolase
MSQMDLARNDRTTTKDETMINDRDAIGQAQALHREACGRLKAKPRETSGEIVFLNGAKLIALFGANGRMAGGYEARDGAVADLDGPKLIRLRAAVMRRKVR